MGWDLGLNNEEEASNIIHKLPRVPGAVNSYLKPQTTWRGGAIAVMRMTTVLGPQRNTEELVFLDWKHPGVL